MLDLFAAMRRNPRMLPPRRVLAALSIWLSAMAACSAQEVPSPARSPWLTLFDTAPLSWSCIFMAIIVTVALIAHVSYVLTHGRMSPPALIDALTLAIRAGNYQETWETCNRWRQTALARMLQPALERIGQGREPAEACLAEQGRRERRKIGALLWALLGVAIAAAIWCVIAMAVELRAADAPMSPSAPRVSTLAAGNIAVLAALAMAVLVLAVTVRLRLQARAERLLAIAGEEGTRLIATLPYEEIEGLRIGSDFNAGTMLGETEGGAVPSKRLQVSTELTSQCPTCNAPVNPTRDACPNCGQLFTWI